jgi:hypothetical protein
VSYRCFKVLEIAVSPAQQAICGSNGDHRDVHVKQAPTSVALPFEFAIWNCVWLVPSYLQRDGPRFPFRREARDI